MTLTHDMGHFLRHSERRRFQTVADVVPRTGVTRVLDAGCGIGELTGIIAGRGFETWALDLGFDSIRRASELLNKKSLYVPFVQGDVYRLPFGDAIFDAVMASEMIEHLENPLDALREIARILRPGGCLIVSTPYREVLRYTLCIHCNSKTPVNAHLHSFDETLLEKLLEDAGFSLEALTIFGSKLLDRIGIQGLVFFLPYRLWRLLDAAACGLFGKQAFMAAKARRRG